MGRVWTLGVASVFGVSTAAVVAVNPNGVMTNAVNTVQQQIQTLASNTGGGTTGGATGGTTGGTTAAAPSISGSCRSH